MNVFRFRSGSSAANSTKSATPSVDYGPITHEPILTQPAQYEPVMNPALDDEQKKKIVDLLAYMDTIILPKDDPYYPNERGFLSEGTAHRYMRARKWDFEVSTEKERGRIRQLSLYLVMVPSLCRQPKPCWRTLSNGEENSNQMNWMKK